MALATLFFDLKTGISLVFIIRTQHMGGLVIEYIQENKKYYWSFTIYAQVELVKAKNH